jgi:hypothetical protein
VVTDVIMVKTKGRCHMTFEELIARIGNKSVFDPAELAARYTNDNNVVVVEMLYYGYFGEGNNVNNDWLANKGYWPNDNTYPTVVRLTPDQFKSILVEGNVDVPSVIIN